ncbi:MAG: hypothetical protein QOJ84_5573 [Bradyrhizobium sp.]|jgi:hypothetical protein|nr:hypothetical protein [Bradyrhizobium sp.]
MMDAFSRRPLFVRARLRKLATYVSVVVLLGLADSSAPVLAAQKTVNTCREEWRADKASYRALGVGEKTYIEKCRKGEPVVFRTNMPIVPLPAIPGQSTMPLMMPPRNYSR